MADENEEYEIEDIVGVKRNKKVFFFRVRWFGYNSDEDTWEPEQNLKHLTKFKKKMKAFKEELMNIFQENKKNGKKNVLKIDRGNSTTVTTTKSNTTTTTTTTNNNNNNNIPNNNNSDNNNTAISNNNNNNNNTAISSNNNNNTAISSNNNNNNNTAISNNNNNTNSSNNKNNNSNGNSSNRKGNNGVRKAKKWENVGGISTTENISQSDRKFNLENTVVKKGVNKRSRTFTEGYHNYMMNSLLKNNSVAKSRHNNEKIHDKKDENSTNEVLYYLEKNRKKKGEELTKETNFNDNNENHNTKEKPKGYAKNEETDKNYRERGTIRDKKRKIDDQALLNMFSNNINENDNHEMFHSLSNYPRIHSPTATKKFARVKDIYGIRVKRGEAQYLVLLANDKTVWVTEDEIEKKPHLETKIKDYKSYLLKENAKESEIKIKTMHMVGDVLYLRVIHNSNTGEQTESIYPSEVVEYVYPHEYLKFLLSRLRFGHST